MKTTTNLQPVEQTMDIIRRLLGQMTLFSDDIVVRDSQLGRTHNIQIQVNRGDIKSVIGSGGEHVKAITALIELMGKTSGAQLKSRVIEPVKGVDARYPAFVPRETWDSEPVREVIADLVEAIFKYPAKVEVLDGDEYMSVVEVYVDQRERKEVVALVSALLTPLVIAIGRTKGRHLSLSIAPEETPELVEAGPSWDPKEWRK